MCCLLESLVGYWHAGLWLALLCVLDCMFVCTSVLEICLCVLLFDYVLVLVLAV